MMFAPLTAEAAGSRLLGKYGDWEAYTRTSGGDKICYVLAKPYAKLPTRVRHGDIYFMVGSWKSGAAFEQPSLLVDFKLKKSAPPTARVGRRSVPMFVSENEAFIESNQNEKKLVSYMRGGSVLKVGAISARGTNVKYDFSLNGITAALSKAAANCR